MSDALILQQHEFVSVLTFNNPPAHTWTPESLQQLQDIVEALNADTDNRALIVTGAGEKFFSAGADLQRFHHRDVAQATDFSTAFGQAFEALSSYRGVSVAAINGYAMGGGLEVALACDVRVAEQHAQLALPECSVGLLPCGLGTQQLAWLVGEQWAKRMVLLGERLSAQQALNIGLVSEIVEPGSALAHCLEMLQPIQKQSPTAVGACKELIMAAREQPLSAGYTLERQRFIELWQDDNQFEGVSAFLEKRPAQWHGKTER
jgi:enoyl-CoA hydratase/carnithine racemase